MATTNTGGIRRTFQYLLLYVLVIIACLGIVDLVELLLGPDLPDWREPSLELARALAYTVVGGGLAAALLWVTARSTRDPREAASPLFNLYLTLMSLTAAAVMAVSAVELADGLLTWSAEVPVRAAVGVVAWGAAWYGHWLWARHRLGTVRNAMHLVLGSALGLALAAWGLTDLLALGFTHLLGPDLIVTGLGALSPGLPLTIVGAVIWARCWPGAAAALRGEATWRVQVLAVGVGAGVVMALFGVARVLERLLDPDTEVTAAVGLALAIVGALLWAYHFAHVREDEPALRGYPYVVAGVALLFASAGAVTAVDEIWRGVAMVVPGAVAWFLHWRVARPTRARRQYLALMLGIAALAAAIALVWLARMLVLHLVGEGARAGSGLGEAVATLVVSALVAGYHGWLLRAERGAAPEPASSVAGPRSVVLVAAVPRDAGPRLAEATGATVETLRLLDEPPAPLDVDGLAGTLGAFAGDDVVVIVEPSGPRVLRVAPKAAEER